MVSSLAAQLAQGASLNTTLLVDRSRRKWSESYLFTGREADQHDLDSIYALAVNALIQLSSLNPSMGSYEDALFSDAAKDMDRTLLNVDANAELDRNIAAFLRLLGPYLLEMPTGKVIEWLVRRFRINEFNVEDVLSLFLPYNETPHFAKMVTILHIKEQSNWAFLLPYKSSAKHLHRTALVTEMMRNVDVARFVTSLLPNSLKDGSLHRGLVALHTSTLLDFIARSKSLSEGELAFTLPALLEPLQQTTNTKSPYEKDMVLGNYVLLSALSQKCTLSAGALKAIIKAMMSSSSRVTLKQCIHAIVCVCAPQDELAKFSNSVVQSLLESQEAGDLLRQMLMFAGVEKFIHPLIPGLISRLNEQSAYAILEAILTSTDSPDATVHRVLSLLMQHVISKDASSNLSQHRQLLSLIQQRYPLVLQKVSSEMMAEKEDSREAIEQLILSVSMTFSTSAHTDGPSRDMVVASTSADPNVRAIAVRSLCEALSSGKQNMESSELDSIHLALLTRIHDINLPVLETLYSKPTDLLPILSAHKETYLSILTAVLLAPPPSSPPSRQLIRQHLTFLLHHFCSKNSEMNGEVFEKVLFPFLMFSKPRQRTANTVWELLGAKEAESGIGAYELLGGCVDVVQWEMGKEGGGDEDTRSVPAMGRVNLALASKIAENVVASDRCTCHLNFLLSKLQDTNPHARHLAYLTARALLSLLSGEHQIDAAHRILNAMDIQTLEKMGDFMCGTESLHLLLNDESLGSNVVLKPSSLNTTHRLQTAILALIPVLAQPLNASLEWLSGVSVDTVDSRAVRYVRLMRAVYRLANSSSSLPVLSASLLQALFINLSDESLAFLAGIWIPPLEDEQSSDDARLHQVALLHAAAFLEAYQATDKTVDFQTILPSLIVALQSTEALVREAAIQCIATLAQLSEAKKASSVYGFDTIYGSDSAKLQFLDWEDLGKYVGSLAEHRDHLANDPGYIRVLHQNHLASRKSDSKKDSGYKQRVLCYLLSHVAACPVPSVQHALLQTVEGISHHAKVQVLFPVLQKTVVELSTNEVVKVFGTRFNDFAALVFSAFDASAAKDLSETTSSSWDVFMSALRLAFDVDSMALPRLALSQALERGLFTGLKLERQVELCRLLLALASADTKTYTSCKRLLSKLLRGGSLVVHLLNDLQPTTMQNIDRAAKRARYDNVSSDGSTQDTLPSLTLLAEIISAQPLPGSPELIVCLLETLRKVAHCETWMQADKSYTEQLIMSALEIMAAQQIPNLKTSTIRLDILVELIRVADNPQTFNQALLLMASMSRLAPDAVLHNVMPVFTFMGSNAFHRDDAYSFNVVQKTIDSIVPVMVSSLKMNRTDNMHLYIASRDFLRIFSDAVNHIPRHRRASFFSHLVDVLGPKEFLAPLCMLFLDKSANRIIRQAGSELHATLALPLSTLQHCSVTEQISALSELLKESQRLMARVTNPDDSQPVFLDTPRNDDEPPSSASSVLRRRAQSLIIFVGYALQESPQLSRTTAADQSGRAISSVVSHLLKTATALDGQASEDSVRDIKKAARLSLNQALGVMSAVDFVDVVYMMLESEDHKIKMGALDVFSDRLPRVSDTVRPSLTSATKNIIKSVQKVLIDTENETLRICGFKAIKAISASACPGEESSLVDTVPLILAAIRNRMSVVYAIAILSPLITKVGPRILPYFREIVHQCLAILRNGDACAINQSSKWNAVAHGVSTDEAGRVFGDAISALVALLNSIPNLWGSPELLQLLNTYLDYEPTSARDSEAMAALMKAVAKKLPSKLVLSTMCQVSLSVYSHTYDQPLVRYFLVLRRSLRASTRPVVLENLRSLFTVFLNALDLRHEAFPNKVDKAENATIAAFIELVVKLNEAAFRPIFRKLYDWAFIDDTGSRHARKVTFCHVYEVLLDFFKGLMTPYMSFLLSPFVDLLKSFSRSSNSNQELWSCVIKTSSKSLRFDEVPAFWRDDRLAQIAPAMVEQIAVCIRMDTSDGKTTLQECLDALAEVVHDDALLKKINLDVLMHTRSEDVRLRIFALNCSEMLWRTHGEKLLGFVADTSTFIAECAEDENDSVVRECHKLKSTVESVAGSIDGL